MIIPDGELIREKGKTTLHKVIKTLWYADYILMSDWRTIEVSYFFNRKQFSKYLDLDSIERVPPSQKKLNRRGRTI